MTATHGIEIERPFCSWDAVISEHKVMQCTMAVVGEKAVVLLEAVVQVDRGSIHPLVILMIMENCIKDGQGGKI